MNYIFLHTAMDRLHGRSEIAKGIGRAPFETLKVNRFKNCWCRPASRSGLQDTVYCQVSKATIIPEVNAPDIAVRAIFKRLNAVRDMFCNVRVKWVMATGSSEWSVFDRAEHRPGQADKNPMSSPWRSSDTAIRTS